MKCVQLDEVGLTLSITVTGSVPWVSAMWGLNPSLNMHSGMSRKPHLGREGGREKERQRERERVITTVT